MRRFLKRKTLLFGLLFLLILNGCGKNVSVSFESAEGLAKKQIENEIVEQTDSYGETAKQQADEIYDTSAEKGQSGLDALIEAATDVSNGKSAGISVQSFTKNALYYFLVIKQYLYNHFVKVLVVWWAIVGVLVMFFRLRNKSFARTILVVLGFGVSVVISVIIFSPI